MSNHNAPEYPPCISLPEGMEPCATAIGLDEHRQKTNIADNSYFLNNRCTVAMRVLKEQGFYTELDEAGCPLRLFADLTPQPQMEASHA